MTNAKKSNQFLDPALLLPALRDAFAKLNPRVQVKNPAMFVTMVGAVLTTGSLFTHAGASWF